MQKSAALSGATTVGSATTARSSLSAFTPTLFATIASRRKSSFCGTGVMAFWQLLLLSLDGAKFSRTIYLVLLGLLLAFVLFTAPVFCGAINRRRGSPVEFCRNKLDRTDLGDATSASTSGRSSGANGGFSFVARRAQGFGRGPGQIGDSQLRCRDRRACRRTLQVDTPAGRALVQQ